MPISSIPVNVLRADDPAWEECLNEVPRDVFHTAGYHTYAQGSGEGEPYLIVVGNQRRGLAWPYLLRPVAEVPELAFSSATDVHSVYGYPGPLAWGCGPGDPFLETAWAEIRAIWQAQGVAAAFTRFHPLLGNAALASGMHSRAAGQERSGPVVVGGPTVSVDLTIGYEDARADYAHDLRRQIDKSRNAGFTTEHNETWTELAVFARLYRETMARLGAADYYFFDETDFLRLREGLLGHLHLLVTRVDGAVAAAGLFTEWDGIVEWYLVGTDAAFSRQSPSKALVDDAIKWAHGRGNAVLHLGGGRGGDVDTLLSFKGLFSSRRHPFHTGRWILEPTTYRELSEARLAGAPDGTLFDDVYFPAYRAPELDSRALEPVTAAQGAAMTTRRVGPGDAAILGDLLSRVDVTHFKPHPMTVDEARRISMLSGRDIYLVGLVRGKAIAYGMLRGWDEGYAVPSLGIGVHRAYEHRGYGRAMMTALHEAAREVGATRIRLRVHPANLRAAELYSSMGYRTAGEERDEILMLLDL